MKFGPLTFQCACLQCNCRSTASARHALHCSMIWTRFISDKSIPVAYILVLVLSAVHLPELALSGGGLRRFGCTQRTRMVFDEWEMSMNQTHPVQQFTSHLLGRPMCSLTTRTLVVAIIDHCNRRALRPHYVVALIHRHSQRNSFCFKHVSPL